MKFKNGALALSALAFASCGALKNTPPSTSASNQSDVAAYVQKYAPIARKEMKKHGIPASITLAQGILESGSGKSELARKSNNHFGIKCHTTWNGKKVYHDDDEKGECFR
ncbi:glucosaminidase domain-containing protein, partial [Flavobacteriaceae bacterium]|nr:glucosaminidase domain-containing protein [Flavobacteriaceae bacterium]